MRPDGARSAGVIEQRIGAGNAATLTVLTDLLHRPDTPTAGGVCT